MGQAVDDIRVALSTIRGDALTAEDQYRQKSRALDLVTDSVVVLNPEGNISYLNAAAEDLYGWSAAELMGRSARATLFIENKATFDEAWRAVGEKDEWRGEFAHRGKSGANRIVAGRWAALREKHSSRISSVLLIGSEVSKVSVTAAALAHEIRNPLAGIKGVADAFLRRRQLTRREREWMEAVRDEVLKIDARMRELLNLSQSRCFNLRQCSLNELISRVVLLATQRARSINNRERRRILVEFIDLTEAPLIMSLDAERVEDAVWNLVVNAIESIDRDGSVSVCLRLRSEGPGSSNGDEALIEVSDTGCGIPDEIRHRIFERLFTTKREGTGLGLAVVHRTAAAFHGRITFQTKIGRGSKFILALPLKTSRANFHEKSKRDPASLF
jgi:two-component system sensor histidine kinase PilS (NtrC family)